MPAGPARSSRDPLDGFSRYARGCHTPRGPETWAASLRCPRDLPPRCRCRRTPPERRRQREQRRQAWQPEERQEPREGEGAWSQSASSWAPWAPRPPWLSGAVLATVAVLRQPPAWLFCTPDPAARAGGDCQARSTRSCSADRITVPRVVAASCRVAANAVRAPRAVSNSLLTWMPRRTPICLAFFPDACQRSPTQRTQRSGLEQPDGQGQEVEEARGKQVCHLLKANAELSAST